MGDLAGHSRQAGREKPREKSHRYPKSSTEDDGRDDSRSCVFTLTSMFTSLAALGLEIVTGSEVFPLKPALRLCLQTEKGKSGLALPLDRCEIHLCVWPRVSEPREEGREGWGAPGEGLQA